MLLTEDEPLERPFGESQMGWREEDVRRLETIHIVMQPTCLMILAARHTVQAGRDLTRAHASTTRGSVRAISSCAVCDSMPRGQLITLPSRQLDHPHRTLRTNPRFDVYYVLEINWCQQTPEAANKVDRSVSTQSHGLPPSSEASILALACRPQLYPATSTEPSR